MMAFSLPTSCWNWRMASRKGWLSMSPTVPPTSMMAISVSFAHAVEAALDLVGDVGDDLHRAPAEVAAALALEHRAVHAGRTVTFETPRQALVDEALIVAEVQVGLRAVVRDEHLAVLDRVHRAGVDVDIGVELLHGHGIAARLEQPAERSGRDPLAEAGDNAAE